MKNLKTERLLDEGYTVTLFKNEIGSYTALAARSKSEQEITDDFTAKKALQRLVAKTLDNVILE